VCTSGGAAATLALSLFECQEDDVPTYEYRCKACGQELEVVQSFSDDSLTTCEACGGALRKVFGNVGIAFKGSGFYKNDSRGKSTATSAGGDKSADSGASAGNGTGDKSGDSSGGGTDSGTKAKPDAAGASSTPKADKPKASSTTT
jgi:putative FmdB family regulatory protein